MTEGKAANPARPETEATSPRAGYFPTDTGRIFYEVWPGPSPDAPSLTLLHNFMSSGRAAWGPMLAPLSQSYRLIVPDLPGHGRSLGAPDAFNHTIMAEQIAGLMAMEGADQGHLAGASSGGMIAQLLMHGNLAPIRTLSLISTTHSTNPKTTDNPSNVSPEEFRAGPRWLQATARLHDPFRHDGYYAEVLLPGFRDLRHAHAIDLPLSALAGWRLPVCLIHGEEDEFFPPSIPERMAWTLPDAELHMVPGQTHALIFRQPWKVTEILLDFLDRRGRAG